MRSTKTKPIIEDTHFHVQRGPARCIGLGCIILGLQALDWELEGLWDRVPFAVERRNFFEENYKAETESNNEHSSGT